MTISKRLSALVPLFVIAAVLAALAAVPGHLGEHYDTAHYRTYYTKDDANYPNDAVTDAQAAEVGDTVEDVRTVFVDVMDFDEPYFDPSHPLEHVYIEDVVFFLGWETAGDIRIDSEVARGTSGDLPRLCVSLLFHHVQYGYIGVFSSLSWEDFHIAGTTAMMTDKTFADLDTDPSDLYVLNCNSYLDSPERSLIDSGHDSAIFWTYFCEQYGEIPTEPHLGADAVRTFLEECDGAPPDTLAALERAVVREGGESLSQLFRDFVITNYTKELDLSALPHSDAGGRNPEEVFVYVDDDATPYSDVRLEVNSDKNLVNEPTALDAWSTKYFNLNLTGDQPIVGFEVESVDNENMAYAFLAVTSDDEVARLFYGSGKRFAKALLNDDYDRVVGIVAGLYRYSAVDYTLAGGGADLDIQQPTPDYQAYVGNHKDPGRFLVRVEVQANFIDASVEGLEPDAFTVLVGSQEATVLAGAYIQDHYWLECQAPEQAGGGVYDLTVQLGNDSAESPQSVNYVIDVRDQMIVIDGSGSMLQYGRLDAAKVGGALLVDVVPDGDMVGVVRFHGDGNDPVTNVDEDATVEYPLSDANDSNRELAVEAIEDIQTTPNVMTSVGDGLHNAQNELASGAGDHIKMMFLLSDGMENEARLWSDVKDSLTDNGVIIHTIALGRVAHEELMEEIADTTGGSYEFADDGSKAKAAARSVGHVPVQAGSVEHVVVQAFKTLHEKALGHQRLWKNENTISGGGSVTETLELEEDTVSDAVLAVNWPRTGGKITVSVTKPDGTPLVAGAGVQIFERDTHTVYHIPKMDRGTWTFTLANTGASDNTYVGVLAGTLERGVRMNYYYGSGWRDRQVGEYLPIFVSLIDKHPVAGADVRGQVTLPNGQKQVVRFYDDGDHGDGQAGDGFYAGLFTRVIEPGSYQVEITTEGVNNFGKSFSRLASSFFYGRQDPDQPDLDNDGLPTNWENRFGLDPSKDDSGRDLDGDSLENKDEFYLGTRPDMADTDLGGETDGAEVARQADPLWPEDDAFPAPSNLRVMPMNGVNALLLALNRNYAKVRIYRKDAAGPYTLLEELQPSANGVYLDESVVNGTEYTYEFAGVGANGTLTRGSPAASGTPNKDTLPPRGRVDINAGGSSTGTLRALLKLDAGDRPTVDPEAPKWFAELLANMKPSGIAEVMIANDPAFSGAIWREYTDQPIRWPLSVNRKTGCAYVYAKFRDKAGNESKPVGDGILVRLQKANVLDVPKKLTVAAGADAVLEGSVLDANGEGVPGAVFDVQVKRRSPITISDKLVVTDSKGRFRLTVTGVQAGAATIALDANAEGLEAEVDVKVN